VQNSKKRLATMLKNPTKPRNRIVLLRAMERIGNESSLSSGAWIDTMKFESYLLHSIWGMSIVLREAMLWILQWKMVDVKSFLFAPQSFKGSDSVIQWINTSIFISIALLYNAKLQNVIV
jgi:hypothetical protein